MKVRTLIEMLSKLPSNAVVKISYDGGYGVDEVKKVKMDTGSFGASEPFCILSAGD